MTWGVYAHQVHLWTIEIQEDSHNLRLAGIP